MRIFCPATLSVLFLPRFVVPPESGRTTSSAQSLTWAATVRTLGDRDTPDPLPLFICHGSPVHAVGRVALPLILRPGTFQLFGPGTRTGCTRIRVPVGTASVLHVAASRSCDLHRDVSPHLFRAANDRVPDKATRPVCRTGRETSNRARFLS